MSKEKKTELARRAFLKDSALATAAIGVGYFSFGAWRKAFAQAKKTGKLVLTEQNLNSIIPKDPSVLKRFSVGARRDVRLFVRSRFSLTEEQEREIESLTAADQKQVVKALDIAEKKRVPLSVRITGKARSGLSQPGQSGLTPVSFTNSPASAWKISIEVGFLKDGSGNINGVYIEVSKS